MRGQRRNASVEQVLIPSSFNVSLREICGAEGIRTPDPRNAIAVLYQLSYDPVTEF